VPSNFFTQNPTSRKKGNGNGNSKNDS
jgi:hypothetical protein